MSRPPITFDWRINLGHILVAISMLTAGTAAYVDLRRDISEQMRAQAVLEARVDDLVQRMRVKDIADATLSARFGTHEELMREVRHELRELTAMRAAPPPPAGAR